MPLQLEYTCTEAEMKKAQSLHLRQQYGSGSKWRARLVLFGILIVVVVTAGHQTVPRFAANDLKPSKWFFY